MSASVGPFLSGFAMVGFNVTDMSRQLGRLKIEQPSVQDTRIQWKGKRCSTMITQVPCFLNYVTNYL